MGKIKAETCTFGKLTILFPLFLCIFYSSTSFIAQVCAWMDGWIPSTKVVWPLHCQPIRHRIHLAWILLQIRHQILNSCIHNVKCWQLSLQLSWYEPCLNIYHRSYVVSSRTDIYHELKSLLSKRKRMIINDSCKVLICFW